MEIKLQLNEDLIQAIQRRQRLMDSMDIKPSAIYLALIEAENQKLAREVVMAYRKVCP